MESFVNQASAAFCEDSRTRSTNGFLFCLKSGPKKVSLAKSTFPLRPVSICEKEQLLFAKTQDEWRMSNHRQLFSSQMIFFVTPPEEREKTKIRPRAFQIISLSWKCKMLQKYVKCIANTDKMCSNEMLNRQQNQKYRQNVIEIQRKCNRIKDKM